METFIVNPHPEKTKGLTVTFSDDGDVDLSMMADSSIKFKLSPEAALELASLIHRMKARSKEEYFSLASHDKLDKLDRLDGDGRDGVNNPGEFES